MTRAGRASSSRAKNSSSIRDALREKTLKLTPVAKTVAPTGEHLPTLSAMLSSSRDRTPTPEVSGSTLIRPRMGLHLFSVTGSAGPG